MQIVQNMIYNNHRLKDGDNVIITLKNGELKYAVNDKDLGGLIKVDINDKKEMYLLVHTRNDKTKCQILSISEIFI